MLTLSDQTGHLVHLTRFPERIVSLVPSQSEYIWDLDLKRELVGITKFCIYPKNMFDSVKRVGGTKQLHLEAIDNLKPDLIIANKEENTQSEIEWLRERYPVYTSDIITLDDALKMMKDVAQLCNREKEGSKIISETQQQLQSVKNKIKGKKVVYLIWQEPYMGAGSDTFIHELLQWCGFENGLAGQTRYPELNLQEIRQLAPDYIFLSSEPFPFSEKHQLRLNELLSQHAIEMPEIILVSGEAFSWYGSRLQHFPVYFNQLLMHLK